MIKDDPFTLECLSKYKGKRNWNSKLRAWRAMMEQGQDKPEFLITPAVKLVHRHTDTASTWRVIQEPDGITSLTNKDSLLELRDFINRWVAND